MGVEVALLAWLGETLVPFLQLFSSQPCWCYNTAWCCYPRLLLQLDLKERPKECKFRTSKANIKLRHGRQSEEDLAALWWLLKAARRSFFSREPISQGWAEPIESSTTKEKRNKLWVCGRRRRKVEGLLNWIASCYPCSPGEEEERRFLFPLFSGEIFEEPLCGWKMSVTVSWFFFEFF